MNVYIQKSDIYCTLTTYIYCAFHMMYNAEKKGHTPYINWTSDRWGFLQALFDANKFSDFQNAYEWYFVQPFGKISRETTWTWEQPNWGANVDTTDFNLMSEPLSVIKDYYKRRLIFNGATNAAGEALVKKYDIDFSKTIGITWRGTDIYLDGRPRMAIETYFRFIDEILLEHPDYRIMCTAEEHGILSPLLAKYPNSFVVDEFISAPLGAKDNPEKLPSNSLSGYQKGLQPVLMVWLFSKCAHYIKNRSSSSSIASWLSDGQIISLAHPENLGYEPAGDYYEINGVRKTPLYI